jgi:hypothetical protein
MNKYGFSLSIDGKFGCLYNSTLKVIFLLKFKGFQVMLIR